MYNFFYRLKNKIAYFMQGRYGLDELFGAMLIASLILTIISRMVSFVSWLGLFGDFILLLAILRCISRNFEARRRELSAYLRIKNNVKGFFARAKKRRAESKTHRFFKCRVCHATLRVPKGKGKIQITCPKCGTKIIKRT